MVGPLFFARASTCPKPATTGEGLTSVKNAGEDDNSSTHAKWTPNMLCEFSVKVF